jgi:hypothetical protein
LRKEWTPGGKGKIDEWHEFELFKVPGKWDVILIMDIPTKSRRGRDPSPYRFPRCEWVVVQNRSIKIMDPEVGRNTKPTENGLKIVLQSEGFLQVHTLRI